MYSGFPKKVNRLLLLILIIGLFFRLFRAVELFGMGHEQDLQAWIIKDILVDKHPRLIGQETSIHGVFIGPIYYYILIPFFAIFNLDPRASIIPIALISILTIVSVYYVFSKLFGKTTGLIGSFIYSTSLAIVFIDRWPVPTQTTFLWIIWYLYVLFSFLKKDFGKLPILVVLIAFIWHVHIAFLPLLIIIPVVIFLSKKPLVKININKKNLYFSILIAFFLILPFIVFEARHGFQQIKSITRVYKEMEEGAIEGEYRLEVIIEQVDRVLNAPIFEYKSPRIFQSEFKTPVMFLIFLGLVFYLVKVKELSKPQAFLIYFWIGDVIFSHYFSKRLLSEYYFNNLMIISVLVVSLFLAYLYKKKNFSFLVVSFLLLFLTYNFIRLVNVPTPKAEYEDKSAAVQFIAGDVSENAYSCVSINYIGALGVEYGYRYLFWRSGVEQVSPGNDIPVYSIVNPFEISAKEIEFRSGDLGVIPPAETDFDFEKCSDPSRQLLPLNGFVN